MWTNMFWFTKILKGALKLMFGGAPDVPAAGSKAVGAAAAASSKEKQAAGAAVAVVAGSPAGPPPAASANGKKELWATVVM